MQPEKEKKQAFAAFLGVSRFSRDVVGKCCIHTTILTGSVMRSRCVTAESPRSRALAPPNRASVKIPAAKRKSRSVAAAALSEIA
jgi:hypothetical protein